MENIHDIYIYWLISDSFVDLARFSFSFFYFDPITVLPHYSILTRYNILVEWQFLNIFLLLLLLLVPSQLVHLLPGEVTFSNCLQTEPNRLEED